MQDIFHRLGDAAIVDLAQPLFVGMPHYPTHPPFTYSLTKKHGDMVLPGGGSSAAEGISMGSHVGTHIDAICHFSRNGELHGGTSVAKIQSWCGGVEGSSIDTVPPIVRRGVLLDIARLTGIDHLPENFEVTPAHLEAAEAASGLLIAPGDVVLVRTGWARFWEDPRRFVNELRMPGPALAGARWLSEREVYAVGSDTAAFELLPSPEMAVHVHLLVEKAIHIVECLNLEELAARRAREFLFVAAPLKIRGGTGSPLRPFALLEERK
jgi:kynurenine formamidase